MGEGRKEGRGREREEDYWRQFSKFKDAQPVGQEGAETHAVL